MRRMTQRKARRIHAMLWAYLNFHARKLPMWMREQNCYIYLLEWAMLGGRPDEVIHD